jgi:hypothetical protein
MSGSIELLVSTTFRTVTYGGESSLWYSIYKREFEQSLSIQSAPPEPSSISNLKASCEGHDVARVDRTPNRPQPWQICSIQGLDGCPDERVIPIHHDVGDVLPFGDGRGADRVRALPQGGSDVGVIRRCGPCEVDVRWEEHSRAVGWVCGGNVGVTE